MQKINVALIEDSSEARGADHSLVPRSSVKKSAQARHMSPALLHVLQEVQRELSYGGADEATVRIAGNAEVEALVNRVAERLGLDLTTYERDEILAFLEKEEKPFGVLQDLVDDPQVTDIIVSSYCKIAVQQGRRNFSTDLSFPSEASYEAFVERLLKRASTTYSTKKPITDGMIGAFARVHAVHRCLCEEGPYITIRLNRFSSVHIDDLIKNGLAPRLLLHYLAGVIQTGQTVLVVGEVGTGKTTLARALASTIPAEESILVIEDTPEIKLEHPHVRYIRTREANIEGSGKISPAECIRGGMRMAMNRIIFGEMRDAEAAEAFIDVCASGHPGLSTIHARSSDEAVTRLELFLGRAQRGVESGVLTQQVATAVQVIVYLGICNETGKRRIVEVKEIGAVADGVLRQKEMFRYQCQAGNPGWRVMNKVSMHRELLEQLGNPVILSSYPNILELDTGVGYREAAYIKTS